MLAKGSRIIFKRKPNIGYVIVLKRKNVKQIRSKNVYSRIYCQKSQIAVKLYF